MRDIANAIRQTGKVPPDELDQALDMFGEDDDLWRSLVTRGYLSEEDVFKALAAFNNLEYVDLTGVQIEPMTLAVIPAAYCRRAQILPIGIRHDHIFLAISNPSNIEAIDDVATMSSYIVAPKVVAPSILQAAIDRYLRSDDELASLTEQIGEDAEAEELQADISDDDDAPIVRFVNLLINQAIQDRASDIHVEPGSKALKVRFRIDGVLHEMQTADRSIQAGVLSRLKIMADIDIAEKRKPQDGRMSVTSRDGKLIDIRVASLPTVWGEKIIMRILDHDSEKRSLDSIGMSDANLAMFREAIQRSHGMVLVTGPTGSGKALSLDTKIPTPSGWTTMGEVAVGDEVLDARGEPTKVLTVSDVNGDPDLYRVTLADGQEIIADGDHQWIVASHASRNHGKNKRTLRGMDYRKDKLDAASAFHSLATLYSPDEVISLLDVMPLIEGSALEAHVPSRGAVLTILRQMETPMTLVADRNGHHYEVVASEALTNIALRLKARHSLAEKPVLINLTTEEMLDQGLKLHGRSNFSIPLVEKPSVEDDADLIIDPYVLGAWLGDGHTHAGYISSGYADFLEMQAILTDAWKGTVELRKRERGVLLRLMGAEPEKCVRGHERIAGKNYCTNHQAHYGKQNNPVNASLGQLLARNGFKGNKHIPMEYLRASRAQRLALLQGLMDTDGAISTDGKGMGVGFSHQRLAYDTLELVRSLGIRANIAKKKAGYKDADGIYVPCKDTYSITFLTDLPVFRLSRKLERMNEGLNPRQKWNYIKSIEAIVPESPEFGPVRCITVDSPDASYLCGDFVVTHNSTSLYTSLDEVANVKVNVITVEDPVEKRIEGVNQVQINNKAGLTFPSALKSILRSDPDIVLIGEIRDSETATIAVEASLTGHLVLSTLHTNGAPDAMPRLIEMGVEPYLVSTAVSCVVAQRLARRLCVKCKEETEPDEELLERLNFPRNEDGTYPRITKAVGCDSCAGTGYRGRLAVLEVMMVTEGIERLVVERAPSSVLRAKAVEDGLKSLREDGWRLVNLGLTTVEEVLRVCA